MLGLAILTVLVSAVSVLPVSAETPGAALPPIKGEKPVDRVPVDGVPGVPGFPGPDRIQVPWQLAYNNGPYYADFEVCGSGYFCWTEWLDRDDPSGTGDYELLSLMPPSKVCEAPVGIECQTTEKIRSDLTGERLLTACEPRIGLQCRNTDQSDGRCLDYRVRFLCPAGTITNKASIAYCKAYCWSDWLNRDAPSGQGDYETIVDYDPRLTCCDPVGVQCREVRTWIDWVDVGQVYRCNTYLGGVCVNNQQGNTSIPGLCRNYEARFLCNCGICV